MALGGGYCGEPQSLPHREEPVWDCPGQHCTANTTSIIVPSAFPSHPSQGSSHLGNWSVSR